MTGVARNGPGRVPCDLKDISFGSRHPTISSLRTLAAAMSPAVGFLVCARSAPTCGHSRLAAGSRALARRMGVVAVAAWARTATQRFVEERPTWELDAGLVAHVRAWTHGLAIRCGSCRSGELRLSCPTAKRRVDTFWAILADEKIAHGSARRLRGIGPGLSTHSRTAAPHGE